MRSIAGVLALLFALLDVPLAPSAAPNRDPDAARLVTSDIPNFWRAFDKACLTTAGELFQKEYTSFPTGF